MKIIIRAVRSREHMVDEMLKEIPNAIVYYDDVYKNAMSSFLHVLEINGSEPVVILEDDVELTSNFLDKLNNAIKGHEHELVQFFSMRKADIDVGSRYDRNYLMGQCTYFPRGYTKLIREYYELWKNTPNGIKHSTGTDTMINDFLRYKKEKYWIHVPSLVQHLEVKSVIDSRRSSKRQSKTFIK